MTPPSKAARDAAEEIQHLEGIHSICLPRDKRIDELTSIIDEHTRAAEMRKLLEGWMEEYGILAVDTGLYDDTKQLLAEVDKQ